MKLLITLGLGSLLFLLPAKTRGDSCRVVNGGRILGSDLAGAVPDLAGLPAETEIGAAPLVGVERVFHTQELARIAQTHGLEPLRHTVEVCFVRKTVRLSEAALRPAIGEALQDGSTGAAPRVEILDYSRYPVAEGKLEFPRGALTASGLWRGRVLMPEGGSMPVWARVRVTDPATGLPVPLGPSAGAREVNRGEMVRVEVLSGHAVIGYDAVAESSGKKGEMVLVTSPDKRRHLLARVEEKGKVSIRR